MCDLTTGGLEVSLGSVDDTLGGLRGKANDDRLGEDARDDGKACEDGRDDTHFGRWKVVIKRLGSWFFVSDSMMSKVDRLEGGCFFCWNNQSYLLYEYKVEGYEESEILMGKAIMI